MAQQHGDASPLASFVSALIHLPFTSEAAATFTVAPATSESGGLKITWSVARDAGKDFQRPAKIATDEDFSQLHFAVRLHHADLRALGAEQQRVGGQHQRRVLPQIVEGHLRVAAGENFVVADCPLPIRSARCAKSVSMAPAVRTTLAVNLRAGNSGNVISAATPGADAGRRRLRHAHKYRATCWCPPAGTIPCPG